MHIAVLTSGGDAPGMNAAVRAVTRTALAREWRVSGFRDGFQGVLDDRIRNLGPRDVGGLIHLGGTCLGTARVPKFREPAAQIRAAEVLAARGIDALVVIGGNGTQRGALALARLGVGVVGVPSTIDNDVAGTDMTIGADTAVSTALDSIDRLRTTAISHGRVIVVEVMGRNSGYLALMAGLAGGAEAVVVPEVRRPLEGLMDDIREAHRVKGHALVVVAEGAPTNGRALADALKERTDFDYPVRLTVLGHVQRGGPPTAFDRILASRYGAAAVDALAAGRAGRMVALTSGVVSETDIEVADTKKTAWDEGLHALAALLAR